MKEKLRQMIDKEHEKWELLEELSGAVHKALRKCQRRKE